MSRKPYPLRERKLTCVIVSTDSMGGLDNGAGPGAGDVEVTESSHQPVFVSAVQPDSSVSVHDDDARSFSILHTPSSRLIDNDGTGDDEVKLVLNPTASRTLSNSQDHIRDAGTSASKRKRVFSPSKTSCAEPDAHRRSTRTKAKQ